VIAASDSSFTAAPTTMAPAKPSSAATAKSTQATVVASPSQRSSVTPTATKNSPLNRAIDFDAIASNISGISGTSFVLANQVAAFSALLSAVMNTPTSTTTPGSPATLIFPKYKNAQPYFNKNTDAEDQLMIESCDKALTEKELEEQRAAALVANSGEFRPEFSNSVPIQ
jgi:hypothetical protein